MDGCFVKMDTGVTFHFLFMEKWPLYLMNKDFSLLVIGDLGNAFPCVLFLSNKFCVVLSLLRLSQIAL